MSGRVRACAGLRVWALGAACVVAVACSDDDAPAERDAGVDASSQAEDAGRDVATGADVAQDAERDAPEDASEAGARVELTRLVLRDGVVEEGELLAVYNHNYWWPDLFEASAEMTFALFDPRRLAPYPDDTSVRLVSSLDVVEAEPFESGPGRITYQRATREAGWTIQGLPLEGVSHVITGNTGYHLEEGGFGDFAWDLVKTDAEGRRFDGDGSRNADYKVWDAPIRLPNAGYVVELVRDAPDNTPGEVPDGAVNNMIGVHIGGSFYLYMLHMRQDTIPASIQVGDFLEAGAEVGRVGNSGVSLEPHLHVVMLWYDASVSPPRSWSVPSEFRGVWVAPSPIGPWRERRHIAPSHRVWLADAPP